jgi:hypothetical protein
MLRAIGPFECAIISGLCLFLIAPLVVGLVLRVLRGRHPLPPLPRGAGEGKAKRRERGRG